MTYWVENSPHRIAGKINDNQIQHKINNSTIHTLNSHNRVPVLGTSFFFFIVFSLSHLFKFAEKKNEMKILSLVLVRAHAHNSKWLHTTIIIRNEMKKEKRILRKNKPIRPFKPNQLIVSLVTSLECGENWSKFNWWKARLIERLFQLLSIHLRQTYNFWRMHFAFRHDVPAAIVLHSYLLINLPIYKVFCCWCCCSTFVRCSTRMQIFYEIVETKNSRTFV